MKACPAHGLQQIAARPALDRLEQVLALGRGRQHHDLHVRLRGFDLPGGRQAVAARHADIHEDQIRLQFLRQRHGFQPIMGNPDHLDAVQRQQVGNPLDHQAVIVGQQALSSRTSRLPHGAAPPRGFPAPPACQQPGVEVTWRLPPSSSARARMNPSP